MRLPSFPPPDSVVRVSPGRWIPGSFSPLVVLRRKVHVRRVPSSNLQPPLLQGHWSSPWNERAGQVGPPSLPPDEIPAANPRVAPAGQQPSDRQHRRPRRAGPTPSPVHPGGRNLQIGRAQL